MVAPTSLPIARLRAAGCKVSTQLGHDPNIGDFKYGIILPAPMGATELTDITQDAQAGVRVHAAGRRWVTYELCLYRVGQPLPDKADREAAHARIGARLASAASYVEERMKHS